MGKNKSKDPNVYYAETEKHEARMHRLVALHLKIAMVTHAYYHKGTKDESDGEWGLFDIIDPHEEADTLINELRFFGFLPEAAPSPDESNSGGDES